MSCLRSGPKTEKEKDEEQNNKNITAQLKTDGKELRKTIKILLLVYFSLILDYFCNSQRVLVIVGRVPLPNNYLSLTEILINNN
jgi:hypothetical protein